MASILPYYSVPPFVYRSQGPAFGPQRVLNEAVDDYYRWNTIKKRVSLDTALRASVGDGRNGLDGVQSGIATYAALTAGEKLAKGYNRLLHGVEEKHPGLAEFRNAHPLIGNIVAWSPGAALAALGGGVIYSLSKGATMKPLAMLQRFPKLAPIAGLALLLGAAWYSFTGTLARKGVAELNDAGRTYRALRREHPDLSPAELKQLSRATRNQAYLQQYARQQALQQRAVLDPAYPGLPFPV